MNSGHHLWHAQEHVAAARFARHVSEQGLKFDLLGFYRTLGGSDPLYTHLNTVLMQEVAVLPTVRPLVDSLLLMGLST